MKDRPKRKIVSTLNCGDYEYYDRVNLQRKSEPKEKQERRPKRQRRQQDSSFPRTSVAATAVVSEENSSSLKPQRVKKLERVDEILGKLQTVEHVSKFTCRKNNCFQLFLTYEDLILHLQKAHQAPPQEILKPQANNLASDHASSSNQPKFHFSKLIDVSGIKSFKCSFCISTFSFKSDLDAHTRWHRESTDSGQAEQATRPEGFTNNDQQNSITETTDFYPCEFCAKIFASLFGLSRHFRKEHEDILELEGRLGESAREEDEDWSWPTLLIFPPVEQEIEVIDLTSDTEEELQTSASSAEVYEE